MRYGLLYGMGFGEQTETGIFISGSKGAGVEPPLTSGYVLAYHEWMQYSVKQGGTAGIIILSRQKAGMGFFLHHRIYMQWRRPVKNLKPAAKRKEKENVREKSTLQNLFGRKRNAKTMV